MQFACFNPDGIWGIGDTEQQARDEAEGYFRDHLNANDPVLERTIKSLDVRPADDELVADATLHGFGYPCITLNASGVLVFNDEPFASDDEELAESHG